MTVFKLLAVISTLGLCMSDNISAEEDDVVLLQRGVKNFEAKDIVDNFLGPSGSSFRFWGHNVALLNETGLELQKPVLHEPAGRSEAHNLTDTSRVSYAQWQQDLILEPILSKLGKGFFVESGALDGEADSNTLMYELKYGWTGLLVEPDPRFVPVIKAKRRRAYLFDGCLSPMDHATTLAFEISENGGLSTISDSGSHQVQAQPLHSLLEAIGNKTVDFWSLDIEGSEGAVLQNTDFSKIEVGVILIEMNKNSENNKVVRDVMRKEGFVDIGHTNYDEGELDHIFVNPMYFKNRSLLVPTSELLPPENRNLGM